MHPEIRHLSLTVLEPESCAVRLAALTGGEARPFKARHVAGAWICLWDAGRNQLVEFIPCGWIQTPGEDGALFIAAPAASTGASHLQLALACDRATLEARAQALGLELFYRAKFGGPLLEGWLEPGLLVEFLTSDLGMGSLDD
ncbi:MAG: hypothetical protein ACAI44_05625 [Candidatus Sericytochromatia bacterium]